MGRLECSRLSGLPGEGQVVESGGAGDDLVDTVATQAPVAEDFVDLHPGESVLDTGPGPAMDCVLGFLFMPERPVGPGPVQYQSGCPSVAAAENWGVLHGSMAAMKSRKPAAR